MTAPLFTFSRVVVVNGTPYPFVPGATVTLAGSGTITALGVVTIRVQARAAGGGGSNKAAGSGAGGGGGAYHAGLQLVLLPGHIYSYVIGIGGSLTLAGGPTYLQDSVGPTNLLYLGGGAGGQNGAQAGVGGVVSVGAGGVNGGSGTGAYADPQAGNTAPVGAEVGGNGGVCGDQNVANIGIGASFGHGPSTPGVLGAGGGGPSAPQNYEGNVGGTGSMTITFVS